MKRTKRLANRTKRYRYIGYQSRQFRNRTAAQDGGISVLRVLLGIFAGIVFSLCAWVGSSIIQLSQDQSLIKEKVSRLEKAGR